MGAMEMSDAQINLAIAKIEYPDGSYPQFDTPVSGLAVDYCDSWSDIGPIIARQKIDLTFIGDAWCAEWGDYDYSGKRFAIAEADTPTKAAALCYLRMKGGE